MKKAALSLVLIITVTGAQAVLANTVTYRVSAYLPAIIGVNVPPFTDPEMEQLYNEKHGIITLSKLDEVVQDVSTQEIVRNNERIILKTFVEK